MVLIQKVHEERFALSIRRNQTIISEYIASPAAALELKEESAIPNKSKIPGLMPPNYREPPPNVTWAHRMMCMALNILQRPTLLEAIPTGIMWDCQPAPASDLDYDNPNPHFSQ
tara:strand:+ start:3398 stop:3739 length:342 start_codon:yes stop_codon:yes gene_type:complete